MNPRTLSRALAAFALSASLISAAYAQNSAPQPVPIVSAIPEPQDRPLTTAMTLQVDATDIDRAIFHVRQTIPVEQGKPLILLYPQWLPGKHGPRGALAEMTGLMIRAGGNALRWTRDPVQVYAFHVDVPAGTASVDVEFQFTAPVRESEGRINVTPNMMNVQWEQVALASLTLLALSACATPETRIRSALMDAGLSKPIAACMADRMVERLSLVQLNRLNGLKKLGGQDIRKVTL